VRKSLGFLIVIAIPIALCAQQQSRLLAGVRFGPTLASVHGDFTHGMPYKPMLGLIAGGSLEWRSNPDPGGRVQSIGLELLYVQKGWLIQGVTTPWQTNVQPVITLGAVHADELVVSLPYSLRFPAREWTPFLELGPEAGFRLSTRETFKQESYRNTTTYPYLSYWNHRPNFGLNMGSGMAFRMMAGECSCTLRYNLGLTNKTSAARDNANGSLGANRTNGIQLIFGYSRAVL
jgi:hypothetical protein